MVLATLKVDSGVCVLLSLLAIVACGGCDKSASKAAGVAVTRGAPEGPLKTVLTVDEEAANASEPIVAGEGLLMVGTFKLDDGETVPPPLLVKFKELTGKGTRPALIFENIALTPVKEGEFGRFEWRTRAPIEPGEYMLDAMNVKTRKVVWSHEIEVTAHQPTE